DIEIAHLKMTLTPAEHDRDLCVVNAVSTDAPPVSAFRLEDVIDAGDLIINLRAEGDPEVLLREATGALTAQAANAGLTVTVDHIEHFRPGRKCSMWTTVTVRPALAACAVSAPVASRNSTSGSPSARKLMMRSPASMTSSRRNALTGGASVLTALTTHRSRSCSAGVSVILR